MGEQQSRLRTQVWCQNTCQNCMSGAGDIDNALAAQTELNRRNGNSNGSGTIIPREELQKLLKQQTLLPSSQQQKIFTNGAREPKNDNHQNSNNIDHNHHQQQQQQQRNDSSGGLGNILMKNDNLSSSQHSSYDLYAAADQKTNKNQEPQQNNRQQLLSYSSPMGVAHGTNLATMGVKDSQDGSLMNPSAVKKITKLENYSNQQYLPMTAKINTHNNIDDDNELQHQQQQLYDFQTLQQQELLLQQQQQEPGHHFNKSNNSNSNNNKNNKSSKGSVKKKSVGGQQQFQLNTNNSRGGVREFGGDGLSNPSGAFSNNVQQQQLAMLSQQQQIQSQQQQSQQSQQQQQQMLNSTPSNMATNFVMQAHHSQLREAQRVQRENSKPKKLLHLRVLSSAFLQKGQVITLNEHGLASQEPLRRCYDGVTFFGCKRTLPKHLDQSSRTGEMGAADSGAPAMIHESASEEDANSSAEALDGEGKEIVNDFIIPACKKEDKEKHAGRQFQIRFDMHNETYFIKDLQIGYGVFTETVGPVPLKDNLLINMGESYIVTNLGPPDPEIVQEYAGNNTEGQLQGSVPPPKLKLRVFSVSKSDQPDLHCCQFEEQEVVIGRSPNCDIRVDDELLSKMQASISFDLTTRQWVLQDGYLGKRSTNGTWLYLNDEIPILSGMLFKSNQTFFQATVE